MDEEKKIALSPAGYADGKSAGDPGDERTDDQAVDADWRYDRLAAMERTDG